MTSNFKIVKQQRDWSTWFKWQMEKLGFKPLDFCLAHPLYRAEKYGDAEILEYAR